MAPGVGNRAEEDEDEADDHEQGGERDRLALLFRRCPANPAVHGEDTPALTLRPRRAAVPDEEAEDQQAAPDAVPAEGERSTDRRPREQPDQERRDGGA